MNIVVTGSLGHISKPIVLELVQSGQTVTVITSDAKKQSVIQSLGAKATIGSLTNANFLADTLRTLMWFTA